MQQEHIKLDFSLKTPEERVELVNKIIENTPSEKLTNRYLEILADYLIFAMTKEETKSKKILTKNRWEHTIKVHETSLEGLSASFENKYSCGSNNSEEDYIYNLIVENDKNIILTPKIKITEKDIAEIPGLKELLDEIKRLETQVFPQAQGKAKFSVKQNIISLYKDTYVLRASYRGSINCVNTTKTISKMDLYENVTIDEEGELHVDANLSLMIPAHVSALLCKYSKLKESAYSKFDSDIYYLLLSLEETIDEALADYPLYYDLLVYKIDGVPNTTIQEELETSFGVKYSIEYISSLWRNKIPKLIAETAQKRWLIWHYTEEEKGKWKRCSRCGQIKLAHNKFFSKNKSSKDGYYSICKDCRNKKVGSVKD